MKAAARSGSSLPGQQPAGFVVAPQPFFFSGTLMSCVG